METVRLLKYLKPYNFVYYAGRKTFLRLVSDECFLRYAFRVHLGYKLNLDAPVTFNEKIQWLKLHDKRSCYKDMVDKYEVRRIVSEKIGDQYLNELYGLYDKYEDIDFSRLPEQFVIKCTHDSGSVFICRSKSDHELKKIGKKVTKAMKDDFFWNGREYPYRDIRPRIIIEKYMEDEKGHDLKDYKLFCFHGKPRFIQVDIDRYTDHRRNLYSADWEYMGFSSLYPTDRNICVERPGCLDEMLGCAQKLAEGIPLIRTDFYVVNERPVFGELTLYHGSGFERYIPQEWDKKLGQYLELNL